MKIEAITVQQFRKRFARAEERMRRCLVEVRRSPTAEGVHEARRAIRKVKVLVSLTPKKYRRNTKVKRLVRMVDRFYSTCTEVRNIDVVTQSVWSRRGDEGVRALLERLRSERTAAVNEARRQMEGVEPRLPHPPGDSQDRLQRRLENQVRRRAASVRELYPKAVADERNVKELHSLRKTCRELVDVLGQARRSRKVTSTAVALQDERRLLGSIRDDDVVIRHLRRWSRSAEARRLLGLFAEARRQKYRVFLSKQDGGGTTLVRIADALSSDRRAPRAPRTDK